MASNNLNPSLSQAKNTAVPLTALLAASMAISPISNAQPVSQPSTTEQPTNVLMILVDDLKPTIGAYGDTNAITPNIDKLARQGMRFDMAYANQAVCMPSRINLMLGSRSTSTGVYMFGTRFRSVLPDAVTMPQYFKQNGYTTESIGKVYHVGHGNIDDQLSWSEEGYHDKVIEYVSPDNVNNGLTQEEALFTNYGGRLIDPKYKGTPGDSWLQDLELVKDFAKLPKGSAWEYPDVDDEAYADGRVAKVAQQRLKEHAVNKDNKPFFMAVGFSRPHLPYSAPKKYWEMYDADKLPMATFTDAPKGAPRFAVKRGGEIFAFTQPEKVEKKGLVADSQVQRNLVHGYYAGVSYMDAQVGKVLETLEETGLASNTLVVLWGDHGYHLGDHGSWTKHSNYEEATKIPLILSLPGKVKANSHTAQIAETVDIYPTVTSLVGLPAPKGQQPIDGEDLTPVLKAPDSRISEYAYHVWPQLGGKYIGYAIRTEQYRMVKWAINKKKGTKYKYELYDYKNDPQETVNIAKNNPEIVARLEKILDAQPTPIKY